MRVNKLLLISVIILVFVYQFQVEVNAQGTQAKEHDFRRVSWGMSQAEVKMAEEEVLDPVEFPLFDSPILAIGQAVSDFLWSAFFGTDTQGILSSYYNTDDFLMYQDEERLIYTTKIAKTDVEINYEFYTDQLIDAEIRFCGRNITLEEVNNMLVQKYGYSPDDYNWKTDTTEILLYKDSTDIVINYKRLDRMEVSSDSI